MQLFLDKALARRLERAEGAINASFVEARAGLAGGGAGAGAAPPAWRDFSGTYAMFDGPESPMTQTFGLGLFERASAGEVAAIEAFFRERGADTLHEVSPLAGMQAVSLLSERGYRPVEMTSVLVRPLDGEEPPPVAPGLRVRTAEPHEAEAWIETSVAGWGETPELAEHIRRLARVAFSSAAVTSFLVEREGRLIATGSLGVHEGVALLAGASTVADERGRGAQRALLSARLTEAKRRGCDVALMGAEPGSTSQRNAERNGFRMAYTRTKWKLDR
jgi:GNAT superfamily N-acetyltransferase